jgi:acetyl-CoA synthetase
MCCAAVANREGLVLQTIVDDALDITAKEGVNPEHVVVFDHTLAMKKSEVPFKEGRDKWWQENINSQPADCEVEWVDAEAPLFKVCHEACLFD